MTISTTSNSVTYTGNGANKSFSYTFPIPSTDDLSISLVRLSDDSSTPITTNYTITGIGGASGGILTYPTTGSAITAGYTITIQRQLDLIQDTDLVNQGPYAPETVESALDYLTMITQQLQEQLDRALAFPVGTASSTAELITDILNCATNAAAAAASAVSAAASAASVAGLVPVNAAGIQSSAVTTAKIASNAVTPIKLDTASIEYGGIMLNGTLAASINANALTVSLLTKAGTSPSATDPVYVMFRSVTPANGDFTVLTITAALSLTITSGSTMGFSNATAGRLWAVIFNDAGTARIGLINCTSLTASAVDIFNLRGWGIGTSTAEGGAGGADNALTFYTGTAVAAKSYATVGYLTWETGLVTAGAWAALPTRISLISDDTPMPGETVQQTMSYTGALVTGLTVLPIDNTIPQSGEGVSLMTKAITPTSSANLIHVESQAHVTHSANTNIGLAVFMGAAANASFASTHNASASGNMEQLDIDGFVLAAATTAITFTVRGGANAAGTLTFNGTGGAQIFNGVMNSYLRLTEIMG